jgi:hypothetical protein
MSRAFSGIAVLGALSFVVWQIGGLIPPHATVLLFGFMFGAFAGIPAMLIIASRLRAVRHDHYHHIPNVKPVAQQVEPLRLSAKPTRYIVIASRTALPVGTQNKIEVGR